MASKSAINLDSAEWDFRPLVNCDDELPLAVRYEYTLKKGFSDWLVRNHIPKTGETGKKSCLSRLKWLAALRLSEHYKGINRNLVEIASDLSKSNLGLDSFGDESVIPFYEEGSSLSRASGRARRFIKSEIACYTKKRFRIAGPVEIRRVAWLE